ncbi:MAG: hypothetical protein ACREM8_12170, partial [Vulcanimicrobiaceae bacterium]
MGHDGAPSHAGPVRYDPFAPPPWPLAFPIRAGSDALDPSGCNGAFPEEMLSVNGYSAPASLEVAAGREQLLRIVNATPEAAKLLELRDRAGAVLPLRVVELDGVPVGGDMVHPLARYLSVKQFMIVPAGRVGVLVSLAAGETLTLSSAHYCEGSDTFFQIPHALLHIRGVAAPAGEPGPAVATAPL